MQDYSGPEYKDLYKEILIDSQWTYGKFCVIPYPLYQSSEQNEMILENLFEEILSELYIIHKNDVIGRKELEEIAATKAQERFEDMCQ